MSKKTVLIAGIVVVALGLAGWLFGPRLYLLIHPPPTPYGWIEKVEPVESFSGGQVKPGAGFQLWLVHFGPTVPVPRGVRAPELLDDIGEKHPSVANTIAVDTSANVTNKQEVYSLPVARKPRSLQFADAPPVPLPGPP